MKQRNAENTLTIIFHILSIALFFILFINGMQGTGKEQILENATEYVLWQQNCFLENVIKLIGVLLIVVLLGMLYEKLLYKIHPNILLAVVCVFSGVFSVWWITAAPTYPTADQLTVCQYASAFNQGNYEGIQQPCYLTFYPQQLGLLTFLRMLFGLFGDMNYRAFQYFSALLVPLLVFSGAMIVRCLTDKNRKTEFYYLMIIVCCVPMYLYVPFVYGDLPSTALGFLAIWIFLSCLKKFSISKVVLLSLVVGSMVQLRKNTLILVIALLVVVLVKIISKFKWHIFVTGIGVLAGVLLFQGAVNLTYAGERDPSLKGIPAPLFIVLGTVEKNGNPGWYNGYATRTFIESEYDTKVATEKAWLDLKLKTREFMDNPEYAMDFYKRKMNYQWNAPMYQGRIMNYCFDGELKPLAASVYAGPRMDILLQGFMKVYQLLMYGSIFFLLLADRKGPKTVEKYVLLIAVFGGFIFSMLWEAKPRYVMPYFLMLVPMYAVAVNYLMAKLSMVTKAIFAKLKKMKKM